MWEEVRFFFHVIKKKVALYLLSDMLLFKEGGEPHSWAYKKKKNTESTN